MKLNQPSKETAFMFTSTLFSPFRCGSCTASCYSITYRHTKFPVSEKQSVSLRTGKRVKGTLSTSVRQHMLNCDHTVAWEDFSVIGRELNHYLLEAKESLFSKRDNPSLNRSKYSQELFLFQPSQQNNFCIGSTVVVIV